MKFLIEAVHRWDKALGVDDPPVFVTVDGGPEAHQRVTEALGHIFPVLRVGQPERDAGYQRRLGVAANKNTGIEALMDNVRVDHLFLSDDDTWPRDPTALYLHTSIQPVLPHSMLAWGPHRLIAQRPGYAEWSWPRGCALYLHRGVVLQAGGMIEAFGAGGHEHVEYSRRISQHGMTPCPYPSPPRYALDRGYGARSLWHAEDMPLPGENAYLNMKRRTEITSMARTTESESLNAVMMEARDRDTSYVPFRAHENGRASATLYPHT